MSSKHKPFCATNTGSVVCDCLPTDPRIGQWAMTTVPGDIKPRWHKLTADQKQAVFRTVLEQFEAIPLEYVGLLGSDNQLKLQLLDEALKLIERPRR